MDVSGRCTGDRQTTVSDETHILHIGRDADGSLIWDSLGQLHLNLLADFLAFLVTADWEDIAVLQLLLAGPVPKFHSQQLLPHPARQRSCSSTKEGYGLLQLVSAVQSRSLCDNGTLPYCK